MLKKNSGVSLITLIITIIVVIILAVIAMVGTGGTIEEANYATYSQNLGNVQEHFTEKATTARGKFMIEGRVITKEQAYNFVAKGGKTEEDVLDNFNLPGYTIIDEESGITLPKMKVESPTGMLVELKYAATKDGVVFTWPPFEYDGKLYVTADDVVGIVNGGTSNGENGGGISGSIESVYAGSIVIGEEKIEISQNTDKGTLIPEGEIEGKTTLKTLVSKGKIDVGSKIEYVPEAGTYTTTGKNYCVGTTNTTLRTVEDEIEWVVIKADGNELLITPSNTVNNEIEFDNALSFINWEKVLNESCKALYSKSEIGAVARSITLEDLGYSVTSSGKKYAYYANGASLSSVSAPSGYTKKIHYAPLATTNNGYGGYRFWKYDSTSYTGNQTLGSYSYTYGYPTTTKPVLVTAKNDSVLGGDTEILNNVKGIISTANTSILLNDNYVGYGPIYLYNGSIMNYGLASSTGFKQFSITANLRPVVSLSLSTTIDGQDANGAWQIVY